MTQIMMSSILSAKTSHILLFFMYFAFLPGCNVSELNNPYPAADDQHDYLYSSFSERPKHLDPARAYSANEYTFIAQIYEPPFQYHYLKRPYELVPLTAAAMPRIRYVDKRGSPLDDTAPVQAIAYSDYLVTIQPGIKYQPHPAFSRNQQGMFLYHQLTAGQLAEMNTLGDFPVHQTRELTAEDYVYQIKRLAHPAVQSPIAEIMKQYIDGFAEFSSQMAKVPLTQLKDHSLSGVQALSRYQYRIRIKGKYPQFRYWLAMPFFAPMPWEADVFYGQPGLAEKNITLDWFPVGTGPYLLEENNPNRRMVMAKNPHFHEERYPHSGEAGDREAGLLADAGKKLPFIERAVYTLEKESIPYWNKFLQGYYDASGIASDSFDQAIQFSGTGDAQLTQALKSKGIQLMTAVTTSIFYMGFNMLDPVVGGDSEQARKLRQAISIAIDYEEYIAIFMNGRGVAAQGVLPPGIFGFAEGEEGMNSIVYDWHDGRPVRKPIENARQLMAEAGYPGGLNPQSGKPLILYFDTTSVSVDDRPRMSWYRKQLAKLGIKLIIRGTDYNRFQDKMRNGSGQLFVWGWNADYPDPENFFFLLYGPNGKVKYGGENAVNYQNPAYDRLFEKMRNMGNSRERYRIIQQMQAILRHDAPWIFGFHPKDFVLLHSWYKNSKPNLMANNRLKYLRIDAGERMAKRRQWNQARFGPVIVALLLLVVLILPALTAYRRRMRESVQ